jgi:hypothetical protein
MADVVGMSVVRTLSVHRRRLTALAMASTLALSIAGADLVSGASAAAAGTTPSPGTSAARPVSVPDDVTFTLDVVPLTVLPDPAAAGTVPGAAAAALAQVPGSAGVTLVFDSPRLQGHLGGVVMNDPGHILVSASQLAGDPGKAADVVRHEIAHIYQARLVTTRGLRAVDARMVELFGPGGLERSADCVALALGATWTHYTTDCAQPERVAAVDALIAGRMP